MVRSIVAWFLTFLVAVGCMPGDMRPASGPLEHAGVPERAHQAAVAAAMDATIVILHASKTRLVCGGQFIAPGLIATANHCLGSAAGCEDNDYECLMGRRVHYFTRQGAESPDPTPILEAWIQAADRDTDLALLATFSPSAHWVEMRTAYPAKGEEVFSVGHPGGAIWQIRSGYVSYVDLTDIQVSIRIAPGASGGGLYDQRGRLLGVTSALAADGEIGIYSPSALIPILLSCAIGHCHEGPPKADETSPRSECPGEGGSCPIP